MRQHFADVAQARDAVIAGDLSRLRPALARVAETQYGDDLPLGWVAWVAQMQEQASTASEAATLEQAGMAVASLARTCGECHETTNAGPELPAETQNPALEGMQLHAWAAEQLWLGLTADERAPWMRGTTALIESDWGEGADTAALRATAQRGRDAAHAADRARIYGELLAQCAGCHQNR